jgi:hypothetical protein
MYVGCEAFVNENIIQSNNFDITVDIFWFVEKNERKFFAMVIWFSMCLKINRWVIKENISRVP